MKTSLEPAEYEIVQGVFKRLAQAPWFDRTASHEKVCAKLVLKHYQPAPQISRTCSPHANQKRDNAMALPIIAVPAVSRRMRVRSKKIVDEWRQPIDR